MAAAVITAAAIRIVSLPPMAVAADVAIIATAAGGTVAIAAVADAICFA